MIKAKETEENEETLDIDGLDNQQSNFKGSKLMESRRK